MWSFFKDRRADAVNSQAKEFLKVSYNHLWKPAAYKHKLFPSLMYTPTCDLSFARSKYEIPNKRIYNF